MICKVGCAGFGPSYSPRDYFSRLNAVELRQCFFSLPRARTIKQWRAKAPEGFAFVVKAWQLVTHEPRSPGYKRLPKKMLPVEQAGHFQDLPVVHQAMEKTLQVAEELQAEAVLFETPPSFTPTTPNQRQLEHFFARYGCSNRLLMWQPSGLWSLEQAHRLCQSAGLVLAWDPFEKPDLLTLPEGRSLALRPQALGQQRQLSFDQLYWLADLLRQQEGDAICLFNSPDSFADAERVLQIVQS